MKIKGKWFGSSDGTLCQVKDDTEITPVIGGGNEEVFLRINGGIVDLDELDARNKVFVKAFCKFLRKTSLSIGYQSLSENVEYGDIEISKTAFMKIIDYYMFGGDWKDVPEYIREYL